MKKLKAPKSLYASQAPPPKVRIKGASTKISLSDMRLEYNGLLAILASLMEVNGGKVMVDNDVLKRVVRDGRVIQIIPGELGTTLQFDYLVEQEEAEVSAPIESNDFLASDVAAEALEYLANQRKAREEDGVTN